MSKIVLFYMKDNEVKATTVRGQAFAFIGNLMSDFNEQRICEIIDEGIRNNGYHFNSVTGNYEFWAAGKNNNDKFDFNNISQMKSNYDAVFKVESGNALVEVK